MKTPLRSRLLTPQSITGPAIVQQFPGLARFFFLCGARVLPRRRPEIGRLYSPLAGGSSSFASGPRASVVT
jgi:hypothetical protein